MNRNLMLILGVAAVLLIAAFSGLLPLQFADTNTKAYYAWTTSDTPTYGIATPEFLDEETVVTSWKQDANSVKFTFKGNMYINECSWAGTRAETPHFYYYVVSIDEGGGWEEILGWENYDRDLIHLTSPVHPGKLLEFAEMTGYGDKFYTFGGGQYPVYDHAGNIMTHTHRGHDGKNCNKIWPQLQTFSMELLGPHVGKIKVELFGVFDVEWNAPGLYSKLLLKDELDLLSGAGSVRLDTSTQIFEEGETVPIVVDTGFSGKTLGGVYGNKGWELRIHNPDGTLVKTQTIPDNSANYRINFVVPSGAYNPSGANMWTVKLWNTLFNQAEEEFFAVGIGMSDQGPSKPTLSFNKQAFEQGDEVVVTISSNSNPDGNNQVYEFYVKAYYGTSGVNPVAADFPKYVYAVNGKAQVSFIANRADTYITVEATAFDRAHNQGGIPSECGSGTIYTKDPDPHPGDILGLEISDIIVIALIIAIFSILALYVPAPMYIKILLILLGIILAVCYWAYALGLIWFGGF